MQARGDNLIKERSSGVVDQQERCKGSTGAALEPKKAGNEPTVSLCVAQWKRVAFL